MAWKHWRVVSLLSSFVLFSGVLLIVYTEIYQAAQEHSSKAQAETIVQQSMIVVAPLCICIAQILTLQSLVGEMVMDKESKMKIVQLVSGVPLWLYWASYA